jgi:hypothetical protein
MEGNDHQRANPLVRWFVTNTILTGIFALLWLIFRSGPKPNRLAYPCQQAAFSTASLAFGAPLVAALITARKAAFRLLGNRRAVAVAAVGLFATVGLWGFLSSSGATMAKTTHLSPPDAYRAQIYHVTDCPQEPVGDRFLGLENLLQLMGREGLKFYRSQTAGPLSGPEGIVAADDVVVLKINYQWSGCGGTNMDLVRGLIRALVDHPDGWTGEVVIGENTQSAPSDNFDRGGNNAEDRSLSPRRIAEGFQNQGHRVSVRDWGQMRFLRAEADQSCDQGGGGYVVLPSGPAGKVSYPRFPTAYGTCVSLKNGVWDADTGAFDRSRLKIINLPVLKPHAAVYGVTAAVKNYMGVVTNELNTGSHSAVAGGLMGAVMAETGPPDLNILDCIRVDGNPYSGPDVSWRGATRFDQLAASTDPVALDIWAVSEILIPEFLARGFSPPWPQPSADPDDPGGKFRIYLDNSMDQLLAAGFSVTNDLDSIDVHWWDGVPAPRQSGGRVGN